MSKEWTGGEPINSNLVALQLNVNKHSEKLATVFSEHFKMKFSPAEFVGEIFENIDKINDHKNPKFFINYLKDDLTQVQFYRTVYTTSQTSKIQLPLNEDVVNHYFDKLTLIFNTFYENFDIVYMGQVNFNRPLNSFISKFITPKANIFQDNIRFVGINPRHNQIGAVPNNTNLTIANIFGGHEKEFINKFVANINKYLIPEEANVCINIDDDFEDLKRNLALVGMCRV